ncbi:serine-rich adhesin for platelets-like isoform X2 [Chrysoperla carnea]|uniref:serine-rich adhesin for platelets-like isoform X2 n=1 Tax=Chrysoperla carnea TaxID=189513 RepID=UPI001D096C83|nr:serine-rich adhesin for platelets-like isoform X2 [Chrysoperla carnea]
MSSTQAISNPATDLYRNDVHDLESARARAARVHRYKEQRRRQLESQFHDLSPQSTPTTVNTHTNTNSLRRRYITRSHKNIPTTSTSNDAGLLTTTTTSTVTALSGAGDGDSDNVNDLITRTSKLNNSSTTGSESTMTASSTVLGAAPGGVGVVRTTRTSRLRTNNNLQLNVDNVQQRLSPDTITNSSQTQIQLKSSSTEKNSLINSRLSNGSSSDHQESNSTTLVTSPRRSNSLRSTTIGRTTSTTSTLLSSVGIDKDKSSKRKSNLNRSLNAEQVPSNNYHDNLIVNQRRRHLAPISVPINSISSTMNSKTIDNNQKFIKKPSQLSIHMENARRSISTSTSSSKENTTKRLNVTSPRLSGGTTSNTITKHLKKSNDDLSSSTTNSDRDKPSRKTTTNSSLNKKSSSENLTKIKKRPSTTTTTATQRRGSTESSTSSTLTTPRNHKQLSSPRPSPTKERINEISRRMDSLTHLTRSTIARVEQLASTRGGASSGSKTTPSGTPTTGTNKKDLNNQLDSKLLMTDKQLINLNNKNNNNNINININNISKNNLIIKQNGAQTTQKDITNNVPQSSSQNHLVIINNQQPEQMTGSEQSSGGSNQQSIAAGGAISNEQESDEAAIPTTSSGNEITSILKKKSLTDHHETSILKQVTTTSMTSSNSNTSSSKEDANCSKQAAQQPISILKRKTSQDESGLVASGSAGENSHHTINESHSASAPVTFSPSVVDPPTASRRRQSILKKRRSLDESEVLRRRSCSPDVTIIEGTTTADFRPILKQQQQRRSSLEEIRVGSPEPQGILKRKTSRGSDDYTIAGGSVDDRSVLGSPEPQSILKRKSGSNSSGGSSNVPQHQHVSIAAAVILAAASGAEIININGDQNENVRPILKKKSISSDESPNMVEILEPKPILKKERTEDYYDERPKKPILKMSSRNHDSLEYSDNETTSSSTSQTKRTSLRTRSSESSSSFETNSPVRKLSNRTSTASGDDELVSILKQSSCSRESSPRPRLSFCSSGGDQQSSSGSLAASKSPPPPPSGSDSTQSEYTFLRRPSMSPIYRSRSSGSDYDERYRKRRTIHLGEGERFFDDSNIRLRRQSMGDMADGHQNGSLGQHYGSGNTGSGSSMSVAERILRMETFLAQEQQTSKHNNNNSNNGNNSILVRRRSSIHKCSTVQLHNNSTNIMDITADPQRECENQIKSTVSSMSTSATASTTSSKTIIKKNSNQSMLDTSQNIICSQNGGETISNHSSHSYTQSHQSHPDRTSTTTTTTTSTNSSNFVIIIPQEESSSNSSTAPGADTNKLLSTSSQSIEILNSEILNSKLTMSSQEPDELTEDHQEQEANSETQLDVLQLDAINSHSSDSGCIEDDVNGGLGSPGVDGGGFPTSISTSQLNNDQLSNKSSTVSVVVTTPSPVKAADSKTHEEDEHESRGRAHSVSSRAAAFNKQAEENQKAATATNVVEQVKKKSVSAGIERYKNRRGLGGAHKASEQHSRFNTQPVTYGEIQEAAKQNQQKNQNDGEDDNDPSKLTLAERVKLFNEKMIEENRIKTNNTNTRLGPPPMRKRYSRFKTQPVTCDEVQSAQQKINPLIASFVKPPSSEELDGLNMKQTKDKINQHAVRMLTSEVKVPTLNKVHTAGDTTPSIRTIYNESPGGGSAVGGLVTSAGASSDNSVSNSVVRNNEQISSSEGESSGEREIRSIMSNRTVTTSCTSSSSSAAAIRKRKSSSGVGTPGDKKFVTKSASETYLTTHSSINKTDESTIKLTTKSSTQRKNGTVDNSDESSNSSCDDEHCNNEDILGSMEQSSQREQRIVVNPSQSINNNKMPASVDDAPGEGDSPGDHEDDAVDNINNSISPSISIAERRAALQHAGNNDWKRRIHPIHELTAGELKNIVVTTNNLINESTKHEETKSELITSSSSVLADRVFKLETASQGWKKRVEQSDAINFTVAGRMRENVISVSPSLPNIPVTANKIKKTPKPARFKTRQERLENKNSDVTLTLTRSISVPSTGNGDNGIQNGLRVSVPRADDETFTSFFTSSFYDHQTSTSSTIFDGDAVSVTSEDLDVVTRLTSDKLLGHKRIVKIQRKHLSKNPIKSLNARTDLQNEYTEIKTGVAEKELTRINAEKIAKNSNMAIAALAGLASKEDFTAINLKKTNTANANSITFSMLPYNDLMLIHIKGRRHVQARLVEPVVSSINRGDNYVLLTKTQVFNYQGLYSNIIEQSRANEIAAASALNGNRQIITIHEEKNTCSTKHIQEFWKLLGYDSNDSSLSPPSITDAGHPDEDEIYESKIIETNMVYELEDNDELTPYQQYWGCIPKIDMLDPNKIFIFDFGTELYVWNGKNSSLDRRKVAVKLAKELWQLGYDYTCCDICPINATQMLGTNRNVDHSTSQLEKKSTSRPSWALLAKITQNMEPVLFREKFLDWPDYSRVIKVKDDPTAVGANIIIKPLDVTKMLEPNTIVPDLILEGSHLGRGTRYYDQETNRLFEISTISVKKWYIQEFEYFELTDAELNHFYSGDSYILRWQYMVTVTGRELSGKPSRHSLAGRDRCAYFCWQGKNASLNEKGAAALLTVELDHERGPQIRVAEGVEPPAFLNLFNGSMIIHSGKLYDNDDLERRNEQQQLWRLYFCRGDMENETFLTEVPCNMRQLRSRASMILINSAQSRIILWHGAKSLEYTKQMARVAVEKLKLNKSEYFKLRAKVIEEVLEGDETPELLNILGVEHGQGRGRRLYMSLLNDPLDYNETPRLFSFSSVSGVFESNEILCPYRYSNPSGDTINEAKIVTPYPFLQSDLYSASQPGLFLLDNGHTLWLWQGWWPEIDTDSSDQANQQLSDQTGSGAIRWQEERRAAMQTTINYWRQKHGHQNAENEKKENEKCPAVLVWAGLEPLEFTNLFPTWIDRDDIARINIKDGRKPGEILSLNSELERLTCCTYPASVLLQRPLPEGVDPTRLEEYLSPNHFQQMFNGLTKEQFYELPTWKQTNLKKEYGLF